MADTESDELARHAAVIHSQPIRRSTVVVAPIVHRVLIPFILAMFVLTGAALGWVFLFGGCDSEGTRRSACYHNLKQIAVALHNYNATHGRFPPAYVADENGRPMHSWRALILPFLENSTIAARYRFDEPWNGPHNRQLHDEKLLAYQCPSSSNDPKSASNYLAVVGKDTAWPDTDSFQLTDFTDGTAQTILIVEVADSDVIWCEPRDLYAGQMSLAINGEKGQGISSRHTVGANVVMADGNAHSIREDLDPSTLRALLTPRGGELLKEKEWSR